MTFSEILKFSFKDLTDPRWGPQKRHKLEDIVSITLLGFICGVESFNDIIFFAESRLEWLKSFLELPYGIPSESTFRRVISSLDPKEFEKTLTELSTYLAALIASSSHVPNENKKK